MFEKVKGFIYNRKEYNEGHSLVIYSTKVLKMCSFCDTEYRLNLITSLKCLGSKATFNLLIFGKFFVVRFIIPKEIS